MVVEELLQFFVGEIDTQLFKAVELEERKTNYTSVFSVIATTTKTGWCIIVLEKGRSEHWQSVAGSWVKTHRTKVEKKCSR